MILFFLGAFVSSCEFNAPSVPRSRSYAWVTFFASSGTLRWNEDGQLLISSLTTATRRKGICIGSRPDLKRATKLHYARTDGDVRPSGIFLGSDLWWINRSDGMFTYFDFKQRTTNIKVKESTQELPGRFNMLWRLYPLDGKRFVSPVANDENGNGRRS